MLFLESAKEAGAQIISKKVVDSLYTDVAIIKGTSNTVLLHISGCHGPEGFAGSAIQSGYLKYFAANSPISGNSFQPTVILVHALNPFGFANNRRVNEINIDLNRNFLTESEFSMVRDRQPNFAGYVDFDHFLNPISKPFSYIFANDIYNLLLSGFVSFKYTQLAIKRAMVSGNYFKQSGLGFGGFSLAKSSQNLIDLVTKDLTYIVSNASGAVLIDVHTGLGKPGVDTLLLTSSENVESKATDFQKYQEIFPTEYSAAGKEIGGIKENFVGESLSGKDDASAGYEHTIGTVSVDFCKKWFATHLKINEAKYCLGQEFGTVPMMWVGVASIDENFAHHHLNSSTSQKQKVVYSQRLRNVFYRNSVEWKTSVARRGIAVLLQGLVALYKEERGFRN